MSLSGRPMTLKARHGRNIAQRALGALPT